MLFYFANAALGILSNHELWARLKRASHIVDVGIFKNGNNINIKGLPGREETKFDARLRNSLYLLLKLLPITDIDIDLVSF